MGGRAFENLTRIKREEIPLTLKSIAPIVGLEYEYMANSMMGSCGKQADSGDIDIAVDCESVPENKFREIFYRAKEQLGQNNVKAMLRAGQINMAVPIVGRDNDRIQVDFIYGPGEWLKFSHWSPGEKSNWKGVFISQALGVLAKMKVLYRYPENAIVDKDNGVDERLAEVAYSYNLEHGVIVSPRMRKKDGSFGRVDADYFETNCQGPMPPRVPRIGIINEPDTVVKMLVSPTAKVEDVNTFEKLLASVRLEFGKEKWQIFRNRLIESLRHSGARYFYEEAELLELLNNYD